jgi:hypothetical protein
MNAHTVSRVPKKIMRFVKTVMAICKNDPTGLSEKHHHIVYFSAQENTD